MAQQAGKASLFQRPRIVLGPAELDECLGVSPRAYGDEATSDIDGRESWKIAGLKDCSESMVLREVSDAQLRGISAELQPVIIDVLCIDVTLLGGGYHVQRIRPRRGSVRWRYRSGRWQGSRRGVSRWLYERRGHWCCGAGRGRSRRCGSWWRRRGCWRRRHEHEQRTASCT